MAKLTAAQRKKLPDSAFALKGRRYPVPTKAQAKRAGISEAQRLRMGRNALSRAGQRKTSGSYSTIARKTRKRMGPKIASTSKSRGVVGRAGYRKKRRGRR